MRTDQQAKIIDTISAEIFSQAHQCAAEQHAPERDSDRSDDYIKQRQQNVAELRRIRDQLEDLFTGRLS